MKIAIGVHGRFYAFDLALALIRRGHEVRVFTNYPKWVTRRFGLANENVRSFWVHGVLARAAHVIETLVPFLRLDVLLHPLFGRWVARQIARESWSVIHMFSGVAEEALRETEGRCWRTLARGSAHIRVQDRLLAEEGARAHRTVERPTRWMIAREEREYKLSDQVVVLSTFARQSFLAESMQREKLFLLPLGVDIQHFRPAQEIVFERCRRIRAGEPLRVLTVGTLCLRKGSLDFQEMLRQLGNRPFQFRFVGDAPRSEQEPLTTAASVEFIPRQPERQLPRWYAWADVFLFPTIEDGFAVVLAQAQASALPILTTTNCSGPDMVLDGQTGWVVPIRRPDALIQRLEWCHANRDSLADMIWRIYRDFQPRDWDDVACDFERLGDTLLAERCP